LGYYIAVPHLEQSVRCLCDTVWYQNSLDAEDSKHADFATIFFS